MKLTADNIQTHLAKGLSPVYFVSGDEPLLADEVVAAIRSAARQQGYEERESHSVDARFNWSELLAGMSNLSLFSSRKIVEIRLETGKPGREGGAQITELAEQPPQDMLFIFTAPKLDGATARSKWVKSLEAAGVWVDIRPLPVEQLPRWIAARMQAAGLPFAADAPEALAMRTEGNLLAAQQEISKLALLNEGEAVTAAMVLESAADGARFDIFQLADAALGQNRQRAIRVLYGLQREGTALPLTLWALVREINTLVSLWSRIDQGATATAAMGELRVWRNRQPLFGRALQNHDERSIRTLIAKAALTDRIVKGAAFGQPWNALLDLVMCMAPIRIAGGKG